MIDKSALAKAIQEDDESGPSYKINTIRCKDTDELFLWGIRVELPRFTHPSLEQASPNGLATISRVLFPKWKMMVMM